MIRCPRCGTQNERVRCSACGELLLPADAKLTVRCLCGTQYPAAAQEIGRQIKCFKCFRVFTIGAPRATSGNSNPASSIASPSDSLSFRAPIVVAVACVVLLGLYALKEDLSFSASLRHLSSEEANHKLDDAAAVLQERATLLAQISADEKAQRERLSDKAFISGERARQLREQEWVKRLSHDPSLANTVMETNLLQMESVGRDPALAAQEALETVARLAAPPGSRIEVEPGDNGFMVRVAFRMSALSTQESGAVTKHHSTASMRNEIESLSAGVMKALFDYCGTRGIGKLTVTCNHALHRAIIPANATAAEKQTLLDRAPVIFGRLYRVSLDHQQARAVVEWRSVPLPSVIPLMTVELDELTNLQISSGSFGEPFGGSSDPVGNLEF
jgi:hypothetical protein